MPQENRKCVDCRFAEKIQDDTQRQCRRAAPTNGSSVGAWPRVKLDDWCYLFEARGGAQASTSATDSAKLATAASWDAVVADINKTVAAGGHGP
ncbi:hypothetical protein HAP41_0000006015 [Bradyrhizobium barranii subsp. apii]|uniref:Uncharacterized protein n=1 Tax=Bradyrhizobium barranii subsp. apii TaxID=2819348 RepID=A0A8T5VR90_9BRAD|nr:hypothetical protein [Bradyrhizobium barranii]UPT88635.1 hypothetical protein HAP41_0000006015 [Bradyrhizobium barranii subsp. apii]